MTIRPEPVRWRAQSRLLQHDDDVHRQIRADRVGRRVERPGAGFHPAAELGTRASSENRLGRMFHGPRRRRALALSLCSKADRLCALIAA